MWSHDEQLRQICEMRNGNEACLTTTSVKSGHRSKVKVVLALYYQTFTVSPAFSIGETVLKLYLPGIDTLDNL